MDSDPVRRQGPERDNCGGGGRPRSFPYGPPADAGAPEGGNGARAKPAHLSMSSAQALTTRPARCVGAPEGGNGARAKPARLSISSLQAATTRHALFLVHT